MSGEELHRVPRPQAANAGPTGILADDGRAPLKSSASAVAAIMLLATKVAVDEVPKTPTLRAGVVAVIGIFGLAWLGDSFIAANKDI